MSTFQVRIEDYIGQVGISATDTAFLSDVLTEGARHVADRMQPQRLALHATDKTDADGTTGVVITSGRPLSAHKSGYEAVLIPIGGKAKALDSGSLMYSKSTSPNWYVDSTKGFVIPGGGTIKWFGYPTVAFGDSTISNYPSEAYGAVVLYAAIQGQSRILSDLIKTTLGGLTFSIVSALPTGASPSFTYTKPTFLGVFTDMATALTNQDVELAQGHGNKISLYLQQYSVDIQNELSEFNAEVENFRLANESRYLTIAIYAAEVNKEVSRIQSLVGIYTSTYQGMFLMLATLKDEFNRLMETL